MKGATIELVIFDCDGVLIDSEIISARILIALLARLGIDVSFAHVQQHFLGRSFPKVAADIRAQHNVILPTGFETEYRAELLKAFEAELKTVPGVEAVIRDLGVAACVATSSSPQRVRRSLEIAGLDAYFGTQVYTASEVANGKPAPDLFLHAARSMGVPAGSCLVIEDSIPGLHAALNAGMAVWRFTGAGHLRGTACLAGDLADVPVFDKWSDFYEMAPELRRSDTGI